jgi:hypothetical protein
LGRRAKVMSKLPGWITLLDVTGSALIAAGRVKPGTSGKSSASAGTETTNVGVGFAAVLDRKTHEVTVTGTTDVAHVRDAASRVLSSRRPANVLVRSGKAAIRPG